MADTAIRRAPARSWNQPRRGRVCWACGEYRNAAMFTFERCDPCAAAAGLLGGEAALRCTYCQGLGRLTRDHVLPRSRGGGGGSNIVPACVACNQEKGARTPEEWRRDRLAAGQPWPPRRWSSR